MAGADLSASSARFGSISTIPMSSEVENYVLSRASDLPARVVVFRPGHVLSRHSNIGKFLRRFAPFYPLIPKRLSSCFIEGTEFFDAIEAERLDERRSGVSLIDSWHERGPGRAIPKPAGRSVGGKESGLHAPGPESTLARHALSSSSDVPPDNC